MTRKLFPARASQPGYPTLEKARRILRGAALAGGLLACGGALGDITPPEHGGHNGDVRVVPRMKGEIARPTPPMPGGMPRPQPQIPQPPPRTQTTAQTQARTPTTTQTTAQTRTNDDEALDLSPDGLNRYVDQILEVSADEGAAPPVRVRLEPAPAHPRKARGPR